MNVTCTQQAQRKCLQRGTEFFSACGKRYWRTLCCIIATAHVPEACVTWSQRKNVQMGSMKQRASLCSNAQLRLATSLEKLKKNKDISLKEKRDGNHRERGNNRQVRETILDFFLFIIKVPFLASWRVSVQSASSTLQSLHVARNRTSISR